MGKSSGVRDVSLLVKCCLFLFRFFKSIFFFGLCPILDHVKSHNTTKPPPSGWVISERQETKGDVISPGDLAEVPVGETGNSVCFSRSLHANP